MVAPTILQLGATVILAFLTGGGIVKLIGLRNENKATDLTILREVVEEVRKDAATARAEAKAIRVEAITETTDLRARVDKLEERERHMLTRAAVHEAWDQIAFAALVRDNPQHPPPPPITPPSLEVDPSTYT